MNHSLRFLLCGFVLPFSIRFSVAKRGKFPREDPQETRKVEATVTEAGRREVNGLLFGWKFF